MGVNYARVHACLQENLIGSLHVFLRKKKGADGALPLLIKEKDTKPAARDLQPGLVSDEER